MQSSCTPCASADGGLCPALAPHFPMHSVCSQHAGGVAPCNASCMHLSPCISVLHACTFRASRFRVAQSWRLAPKLWRCGVNSIVVDLPQILAFFFFLFYSSQILAQQDFLVDFGFLLPSIGLFCSGGSGSPSRFVSRRGIGPADYVTFWGVRFAYPSGSCDPWR